MSLENEALGAAETVEGIAGTADGERHGESISDFLPDFSFLKSKTGDGSIEDYITHPLNIKENRGVAQILRGITGIAGELDYAIIDIALGTIEIIKEKTKDVTFTEQ